MSPNKRNIVVMIFRIAAAAAAGLLGAAVGGCRDGGDLEPVVDAATGPAPADAGPERPPASRCLPPGGLPAVPRSIAELVELVNVLPRPLSLPCFLQTLARPLQLQAASSLISLQPSVGQRSPRMFLFSGPLVMSIVPEGKGAVLVELGQLVGPDRSLKGELAFPVTDEVTREMPYARIRDTRGTTCRVCHKDEEQAADIGYAEAFISGALKPQERSRVPLETLMLERQRCGDEAAGASDDRCAMFRALFDHGEVRQVDFPATIPTIFD